MKVAHVDGPSKDRYRRSAVGETATTKSEGGSVPAQPDASRRVLPSPGGLAARFAGGAAVMVLFAAAVLGLVVGARTTRLYAGFENRMQSTLREALERHLRSAASVLAREVVAADAVDDWSALQARLPEREKPERGGIALCVTDADGLVLADVDPARNGHPVTDDRMTLLQHRVELPPTEITIAGRAMVLTAVRAGDARLVWASADTGAEQEARARLRSEARAAVRLDWLLVGLGALISVIVAVGAVLLVSGAIARRLRALAWRLAELGRGDYSTHLQVGGPAELRLVGDELALAARRIEAAAQARARDAAQAAERSAQRAVVAAALDAPRVFGELSVAAALAPASESSCACAVGIFPRADGGAVVIFIEIASSSFTDALLAAQLRACIAALFESDPALSPKDALRRIDPLVGAGRRARACLVVLAQAQAGEWTARIALAGARPPLLRSANNGLRALLLYGDRLGEPAPERGGELMVTLGRGDALVVLGDAPLDGPRTLDGHAARALKEQIESQGVEQPAEAQARAIVAPGEGTKPTVAVVIGRGLGS